MHFGTTLKLLRTDAGLSLRALAGQVGVSSAYLSRVENGHDPAPTPDRLNAIAAALHLPADTLVDLAHQTGAALSAYIDRVPAASGFFLDVARRNLDADQLARLRQLMDEEFPPATGSSAGPTQLCALIGDRIELDLAAASVDEVIDAGVALCVDDEAGRAAITRRVREREALAPTALGDGVAIPHAIVPDMPTTAALVTLAEPLAAQCLDGSPVEVAIVLLSGNGNHEHLRVLAQLARLASHGLAEQLRSEHDPESALASIRRIEAM